MIKLFLNKQPHFIMSQYDSNTKLGINEKRDNSICANFEYLCKEQGVN